MPAAFEPEASWWRVVAVSIVVAWLPCALAATAHAQAEPDASSENEIQQEGERVGDDDVGVPDPDADPAPDVPGVLEDSEQVRPDVIEQAGVGGPVAYAQSGVLEVGGGGGLVASADYQYLRLAPFVGWFLFDGLRIGIANEIHVVARRDEEPRVGFVGALEASVHAGLGNDRVLAMVGVTTGALYNSVDWGWVVRPRVGLDVLIGRSGLFRPALFLSWATVDQLGAGRERLEGPLLFGAELAYAAIF